MSDTPPPAEGERHAITLADADKLVVDAAKALNLAARVYEAAAQQSQGALHGQMRQRAWNARQMERGAGARWFSQAGQDRYLDEVIFKGKRGGVFLDVGAYDGATGSNTLFFEAMRGWTGLMVEPSPTYAAAARACRNAPLAEVAIAPKDGEAEFLHITAGYTQMSGLASSYDAKLRQQVEADSRHAGETIAVKTRTLASLIEEHALGPIDFVSLDIEGGEVAALSAFDFAKYPVHAWTIENNAGDSGGEIGAIMAAAGYARAAHVGVDEIYVRG